MRNPNVGITVLNVVHGVLEAVFFTKCGITEVYGDYRFDGTRKPNLELVTIAMRYAFLTETVKIARHPE